MRTTGRRVRFVAVVAFLLSVGTLREALAAQGVLTIPTISGRPERQPFAAHLGWIDAYVPGSQRSISARLKTDATFELPDPNPTAQGPPSYQHEAQATA
ncbi:MAG: hypothetical protein HY718_04375 [Planctomycetes bacterium]|nr:hypothetical protein [Planctomycetota bacterium]